MDVLACCVALALFASLLFVVHTGAYYYRRVLFRIRLYQRRRNIRLTSSKRAGKLLDLLDADELGDDVLALCEGHKYVRCAIILSREARRNLRYPRYSQANERIACDWIEKHYPEGVTGSMRHRITPLAVKLTFVRSRHEIAAQQQFEWLMPEVDVA